MSSDGAAKVVIMNAKQQNAAFGEYLTSLKGAPTTINAYNTSVKTMTVASKAAAFGIGLLKTALNMGVVLLVSVAIQKLVTAISDMATASERAVENAVQVASATKDQINTYKQLKQEYVGILDSTEKDSVKTKELAEWKRKLVEQYSFEKDAIDKVNLSRQTGIDLMDKEIEKTIQKAIADMGDGYDEAVKVMEAPQKKFVTYLDIEDKSVLDDLREFGAVLDEIKESEDQITTSYILSIEGDSVIETLDKMSEAIERYRQQEAKGEKFSLADQNTLDGLQKAYDALNKTSDKYRSVYEQGSALYAQSILLSKQDGIAGIENQDSYNKFKQELLDTAGASEALKNALIDELANLFPQFTTAVQNAGNSLGGFVEYESQLGATLGDLFDKTSVLSTAFKELDDGQGLSYSSLTKLLEAYPQLIDALEIENGIITLNKQALEDLFQAEIKAKIEALNTTKTNTEQKIALIKAEIAELERLVRMYALAGDTGNLMYSLRQLDETKRESGEFQSILDRVNKELDAMNAISLGGLKGTIKDTANAAKEMEKAFQDAKSQMQAMQSGAIKIIDKEIKNLRKSLEDSNDAYDSQIDALRRKLKLLEREWETNDRLLKIEKARQELAKAEEQRTNLIYRAGQGFVYEADQSAVQQAREGLNDELRDYNRYQMRLELEDKIKALEDAKERAAEIIEEEIEQLELLKEMWQEALDQATENTEEYAALLEYLAEFEGASYEERIAMLSSFVASWNALVASMATPSAGGGGDFGGGGGDSSGGSSSHSPSSDSWGTNPFRDIRGYSSGGTADYTGLAVLHGKKTSAETIFSAANSKKLHDLVNNTDNLSAYIARELSSKLMNTASNISSIESSGSGARKIEVVFNGDMVLSNVKDADGFAKTVKLKIDNVLTQELLKR